MPPPVPTLPTVRAASPGGAPSNRSSPAAPRAERAASSRRMRLEGKRPCSWSSPCKAFISAAGSSRTASNSPTLCQTLDDHDHQRLEEEPVGVEVWSAASEAGGRWWRGRKLIDQADELDKEGILGDHEHASGSSVFGHTPSSGAFRSRSSRLPASISDL